MLGKERGKGVSARPGGVELTGTRPGARAGHRRSALLRTSAVRRATAPRELGLILRLGAFVVVLIIATALVRLVAE